MSLLKSIAQTNPVVGSLVDWSHPLSKGLVGCWLFNERTGSRAKNIAGNDEGLIIDGTWNTVNDGLYATGGNGAYYSTCPIPLRCTSVTYTVKGVFRQGSGSGGAGNSSLGGCHWDVGGSSPYNSYGVDYNSGGPAVFVGINTAGSQSYLNASINWNSPNILSLAYKSGDFRFHQKGIILNSTTGVTGNIAYSSAPYFDFGKYMSRSPNSAFHASFVHNRCLSKSEIDWLHAEPYSFILPPQLMRSYFFLNTFNETMSGGIYGNSRANAHGGCQEAQPSSDISVGSWTIAPLFNKIDEVNPDDADFISSSREPSNDACEVKFTSLTDPSSSVGHTVYYRVKNSGDQTVELTVSLVQGTTIIASWVETLSSTIVERERTLSALEANSITDYTDLRLRFTANKI